MRVKYVLSEVLVGLWRNVTMSIAMIITMAVSLTMLGASGLLYRQVDDMKDLYFKNIQVAIFLNQEVSEPQRTELKGKLEGDPWSRRSSTSTRPRRTSASRRCTRTRRTW